jgi:hypothetical protein
LTCHIIVPLFSDTDYSVCNGDPRDRPMPTSYMCYCTVWSVWPTQLVTHKSGGTTRCKVLDRLTTRPRMNDKNAQMYATHWRCYTPSLCES